MATLPCVATRRSSGRRAAFARGPERRAGDRRRRPGGSSGIEDGDPRPLRARAATDVPALGNRRGPGAGRRRQPGGRGPQIPVVGVGCRWSRSVSARRPLRTGEPSVPGSDHHPARAHPVNLACPGQPRHRRARRGAVRGRHRHRRRPRRHTVARTAPVDSRRHARPGVVAGDLDLPLAARLGHPPGGGDARHRAVGRRGAVPVRSVLAAGDRWRTACSLERDEAADPRPVRLRIDGTDERARVRPLAGRPDGVFLQRRRDCRLLHRAHDVAPFRERDHLARMTAPAGLRFAEMTSCASSGRGPDRVRFAQVSVRRTSLRTTVF
ncbi:hypothetical protein P3T27_007507 [Kitasatospora sp. MAA19]|nr:hypothetical protein [Kitasatospora sp. MAA19]